MSAQPTITALTFEQHSTGRGIGIASPRMSWKFAANDNTIQNWEQSAYDLEITRGSSTEDYHIVSSNSLLVPWPSRPLHSREIVRIRIRSYGGSIAAPTDWSAWETLECGLLKRQDWTAHAISHSVKQKEGPLRPLRFRKPFRIQSLMSVTRARLYITSLGVFQAYTNGSPVGDHFLAPGWTSYRHRLNYEVFDIAPLLHEGENIIAVEVAEGWYATRLGFHGGKRFIYGDEMALIAQLEIDSEHGREVIISDSSWKSHTSALISSEIYDGEVFDAREEVEGEGWTTNLFQDHSWCEVREIEFPKADLISPNAPSIRVTQIVKPVAIITSPSGKTIVDFGQNLVGRIRIPSLQVPQDTTITLTHAEVLENNELGTRPLRIAKCTDIIISSGRELQNWAPRFTFHGFRYVQITNWIPTLTNLHAEVLHTDLIRTGTFKSSHPMINKLHENATWSMRGNFLSIPTDCPQRDERLGWTGDIQIFAPSASFLYNTAGMLSDWLEDLSVEQLATEKGIPPFVVPDVLSDTWPCFPQAIWDDVTILLPWTLYQTYGDVQILARQYESMVTWLDRGVRRGNDRLWDDELFQLGDWLDPTAPPENPGNARTDGTFVADAYLVHVTRILGDISAILGHVDNAARYKDEYLGLKRRFQDKYVTKEGYLVGDTQTALALVIYFDLLDSESQIENAGARLARLVRKAKFQVSTGFAGTPIITHALCKVGYVQLAYRMLQEKTCPSWMFPITMGATTIWERWDSMRADGSINPGEMTSFNHYALGSIVNWLHKDVAGVSLLEPGWKRFLVKPLPGGTITSAEVRYNTPFGELECRWALDGDFFRLSLFVPPNTSARVVLPGGDTATTAVGSGRHEFESRFDSAVGWPPKPLEPPMFNSGDTFV